MAAKSSFGKLWGPVPKATRWIYESMVRPIILYGAIIWAHKIPKNFKPLIRLQRLALMCLGSFAKSTPTKGLEIIFNYMPLDLLAKQEALKAALRLGSRNKKRWDGVGIGSKRGHLFYYPPPLDTMDRMEVKYNWDMVPELDMDSGQPLEHDGITCYTDGSKMAPEEAGKSITTDAEPGVAKAGFGVLVMRPNEKPFKFWGNLGARATVFQAEVMAIHQAARSIMDETPTEIHFYSDSQPALLAITSTEIQSLTVWECLQQLIHLMQLGHKIVLHWVKAHAGHEHNEEADRLAKFGTLSNWKYSVPLAWAQVKQEIRTKYIQEWMNQWGAEPTCRQTRLILPEVHPSLTQILMKVSRPDVSKLAQFITGHNYLQYHLFNTNVVQSPTCRVCGEENETAWHLLAECPALARDRLFFFLDAESLSPPDPKKLWEYLSLPTLHQLLSRNT